MSKRGIAGGTDHAQGASRRRGQFVLEPSRYLYIKSIGLGERKRQSREANQYRCRRPP